MNRKTLNNLSSFDSLLCDLSNCSAGIKNFKNPTNPPPPPKKKLNYDDTFKTKKKL